MLNAKTFNLGNGCTVAVAVYTEVTIITLSNGKQHIFKDQEEAVFWLHETFGIDLYGD